MIRLLLFAVIIALVYRFVTKGTGGGSAMSAAEAANVLGVAANASSDAVLDAHRRLIAKVHPDAGGSAELAARVNQARDILLKQISK